MPSSVQSAFSASARLSVECSETDREPARGNVFPSYVHDDRRSPARALGLNRNACAVDGDQLALDDRLGLAAPIANVHSPAVETLVVLFATERSLSAGRGDLEVVRTGDQLGVVEKGSHKLAHVLAVLDSGWLGTVDGRSQRPPALARLLDRVELVAHVFERGLEKRSDRRYWPGRHVAVCTYLTGWVECRRSDPSSSPDECECGLSDPLPDWLKPSPDDQERSGVEDRAVGARDDADEQGQGEALEARAAGDEDGGQDQDDGEARDDRPRGGLHDAEVDDLLEGKALAHAQVLANPVEDHDGVVHREAHDGEHGGDEEAVDLADPQAEHRAHDRDEPGEQEHVVQQRGERRAAELKARAPSAGDVAK